MVEKQKSWKANVLKKEFEILPLDTAVWTLLGYLLAENDNTVFDDDPLLYISIFVFQNLKPTPQIKWSICTQWVVRWVAEIMVGSHRSNFKSLVLGLENHFKLIHNCSLSKVLPTFAVDTGDHMFRQRFRKRRLRSLLFLQLLVWSIIDSLIYLLIAHL